MNPFEVTCYVGTLIEQCDSGLHKSFWIVIRNGELVAVPSKSRVLSDIPVFKFFDYEIQGGLTTTRWNQLQMKVTKWKGKFTCPHKLHKH